MSFPLYYFLFPYGIFAFVWVILSLVGFYHLMRFGFRHIGLLVIVLIYIGGAAFLIQVSYAFLEPVDWSTPVRLFTNLPAALPSFGTSY